MKKFELLTILLAAYFLVCLQISFHSIGFWIHGYIQFPALAIIYSSTRKLSEISWIYCVIVGLWVDSLSMNPLGLSILTLIACNALSMKTRKALIGKPWLSNFSSGFITGSLYPCLTVILLLLFGESPVTGWRFILSVALSGLVIGLLSHPFKNLMDFIIAQLEFKPAAHYRESEMREIERR